MSLSPEMAFDLKLLILAAGIAATAVLHTRWISNRAGRKAAKDWDDRQLFISFLRKLDD